MATLKHQIDLSKLEEGRSLLYHSRLGWVRVIRILPNDTLPLYIEGLGWYTLDGRYDRDDKHPSLFVDALECSRHFYKPPLGGEIGTPNAK